MSKKYEKVVETKICRQCQRKYEITDNDLEFYEKISPTFPMNESGTSNLSSIKNLGNGKNKYLISPPSLCQYCKQQQRLSFRNERNLYKRKCDASGKPIISIYSPDKTFKVYNQDFFRSDKWDPLDYGKEFDFNKSFFEQFSEFTKNFPKVNLFVFESENCEYNNHLGRSKNCFYTFASGYVEDIYYSYWTGRADNLFDCTKVLKSSNLYYSIDCIGCNNSMFLFDCNDTSNSIYLKNCNGCHDCIACVNLNNKSYYIGNIEYSKEEYKKIKEKLSLDDIKNLYENVYINSPHKNLQIVNCENVDGNKLLNCKNVFNTYDCEDSVDNKNVFFAYNMHSTMDNLFCNDSELFYEGLSSYSINNSMFCSFSHDSYNLMYCLGCISCKDCFGCEGLSHKQYCILNKQYTKEEYEKLVPKIIEHMMTQNPPTPLYQGGIEQEWGEFFPSSISPFGYNETVAQEYFPVKLSEDRKYMITEDGKRYNVNMIGKDTSFVIPAKAGIYKNSQKISIDPRVKHEDEDLELKKPQSPIFLWSDYEAPFPKVDKIIPASKLPDDISKIPDDILNRAIMPDDKENEVQKPFRIIKQELEFYRKHNLPIPRKHPDQRHLDRMSLRNSRKLYDRLCDCEKCEEYAKETNTFKKEDFEYKISETNGGGQRRKIKTTYSPDREEIVYCQVCYDKEIY